MFTNSFGDAATTRVADNIKIKSAGDYTFLGTYRFHTLDTASNVGGISVVKEGDWILDYAAFLGRSGSPVTITNVSGNIVYNRAGWFQIGNSSTAVIENVSGDWTIAGHLAIGHGSGSRGELYWRGGDMSVTYGNYTGFAYGENSSAVVEKEAGDWNFARPIYLATGENSTANMVHRGGTVVLGPDYSLVLAQGANSTASLDNVMGDWSLNKNLYMGWGKNSKASLDWHGGNLTAGQDFAVGYGADSSATVNWRGGNLIASRYFTASEGSNSVSTITKEAGDWTIKDSIRLGRGGNKGNGTGTAATAFFHNGGRLNAEKGLEITYDGSCDFHMNGGEVSVAEAVVFGAWYLGNPDYGRLYLNGGVMAAKAFKYHNGNVAANIVFDGGTFRAAESGNIVTNDMNWTVANLRNYLSFAVGPKGGTIDTAGHDITNAVNFTRTSGTGGMRFTGGGSFMHTGSVGYTGRTYVDAGTTLEVTDSGAKSNILKNGLELSGAHELNVPYTVFVCAEDLVEEDLANVTCDVASGFTKAIGEDGRSIVVTRTGGLRSAFWTGAKDGNLSDPANWSDGIVPVGGNPVIALASSATLAVGDTFKADTITIPDNSEVVTIGAGNLHLSGSLTNAAKLAVAKDASLTIDGDLVAFDGQGTFLFSNEGDVTVGGNAVCATETTTTTTRQYQQVTEDTRPIRVGGILYDRGQSGRIFWRLESQGGGAGSWVVGSNGFVFQNPESRYSTRFYAQNSPVMLYSSADWTLANSGCSGTTSGDLEVYDDSSLSIDTSDYDNPAVPHTVTLEGRIKANGDVTISGCGTVVVATIGSSTDGKLPEENRHTIITNATLAVTDTATLKIKEGRKIVAKEGSTLSLGAGTTLAFESGGGAFTAPEIPVVTLPTEGKATLRIDGRRLSGGDHVLLNSVPEGYAEHLTVTGSAIAERAMSVRAEDGKLILSITPKGLTVILK